MPVWGSNVVDGHYAGHPGLLYQPRPTTFAELLDGAQRWSERTFLVQGRRRITYAAFIEAIRAARRYLRELGIARGDRVLLFAYNSPEWALAVWALWTVGAVPVLGNRWWSGREIEHAVTLLTPAHAIGDTELAPMATTDIGALRACFDAAGQGAVDELDEDSVAVILFTSGSSGMPKAVELSRRAVICNQHSILLRSGRLPDRLDVSSPQVVSLASTPMFHVGGLSNLITQFLTGGRIVLTEGRFDPKQILELIQTEQVQSWGAVPTMAIRVIEHPDFDAYDLSSLRSWPLGGAQVTAALLDRIRAKMPGLRRRGLANTWGMTEAGGFLTMAVGSDLERYPGTVGRPYPVVELKIDRPDADGVGEVLARSPSVMRGYAGIDDGTVDSDGWLHTGDLGHLNEDGYLFIDGRSKDVVIRGGENIACPHVEAAIATHPSVVEVAAIGLPHPDLGEELAAVVVHRPDARPPTEEELRRHLDGVVAYFAIPTRWEIRGEPLPTLAGEKVDKRTLAAQFRT
ncbi:class I adenylate-forming enzyme family protein [Mycobacterium sp. 3519A]|uniref:class I adenylate-forming enzyme family protein n=1 Tax=Mycobacterium sp. 3519A TaxID=2057184 RepID=UPI001F198A2E|nr:class I adenylate-forming enzyme family protein [Mycobacterium sp. 3519A]